MARLKAAQGAGGKVIHEAFKIAKGWMDKGGSGRMEEVYKGDNPEGDVITKGEEVIEGGSG